MYGAAWGDAARRARRARWQSRGRRVQAEQGLCACVHGTYIQVAGDVGLEQRREHGAELCQLLPLRHLLQGAFDALALGECQHERLLGRHALCEVARA